MREALSRRQGGLRSDTGDPRREHHPLIAAVLVPLARSPPVTATASTTRWCSRCWRDEAPPLAAYALEYLVIGLARAIVGVAARSVAASLVMTEVKNLSFVFLPVPALAATVGAAGLTIAFGLIGTFSALGQKPAPVLRHL